MDEATIENIFDLTERNMSAVLGSTSTREEDYVQWRESFDRNLRVGTRYLLCEKDGLLRGYLAYTHRPSQRDLYVNEVQIHPQFRRSGITLRRLVTVFLDAVEHCECDTVRTYANGRNVLSQTILCKMGFEVTTETERGIRFCVDKALLVSRLNRLRESSRDRTRTVPKAPEG